jgi:hypothetical protein
MRPYFVAKEFLAHAGGWVVSPSANGDPLTSSRWEHLRCSVRPFNRALPKGCRKLMVGSWWKLLPGALHWWRVGARRKWNGYV